MPERPQQADGMRMDPPPSDPVARGTMPAASAAAAPPEDLISRWLFLIPVLAPKSDGTYGDAHTTGVVLVAAGASARTGAPKVVR